MIVALTPTGGRPEAFALCEKYMARQTVMPDAWIVVDDVDPPTRCTMGQQIVRPEPRHQHYPEPNSQHRNILAGLPVMGGDDLLIFFEDDDWYSAEYIETQKQFADRYPHLGMFGQVPSRYYRVDERASRVFEDTPHSSLASTAFRGRMLEAIQYACESRAWLDTYLWKRFGANQGFLWSDIQVVGIKGMPGRAGVSAAHRQEVAGDERWQTDLNLVTLERWIGKEDASAYLKFWKTDLPDFSRENEDYDWEWFLSDGQKRYRCSSCQFDHYSPVEVGKHYFEVHEDRPAAAQPLPPVTLFDADGKQINRKIVRG